MDPLLEVMKLENIWIGDLFVVKPFKEEGEVFSYLFSTEYAVYHMAAKQSELYFVPSMGMDLFVFMNAFEDMRGS